jgi:aryl-alcohol dehydrogenase-like predicted oxidoreductase
VNHAGRPPCGPSSPWPSPHAYGGTNESQAIATIRAAIDHGVDLIDTAPAYGFGRSEEIVGKALAESGLRSRVAIATKV